MKQIKFSVIIPTCNRVNILDLCLSSLEKSNKNFDIEIVIVDDGSNSENKKILTNIISKSRLDIKVFFQKNIGPAGARNMAINESTGDVLIFINDDTLVNNSFFERHFVFHQKHKKEDDALLGLFINHPDIKFDPIVAWFLEKSNMHFYYPDKKNVKYELLPWHYFWTNNISIKKEFFVKNKIVYDVDFMTAAWEDVEFGWRAKKCGLKIYLDRNLIAYHYHALNFDDLMARFYSHGRGLYTLSKKVDYKELPPLAKGQYRLIAKIALLLIAFPITVPLIKKYLMKYQKRNYLLMQILVVNQKILGFEYQKMIS